MMICQQYGIAKMLRNLIILREEQKKVVRIAKLEDVILAVLVLVMEFIKA